MKINKEEALKQLNEGCIREYGHPVKEATNIQVYRVLCRIIRDALAIERNHFYNDYRKKEKKEVFYMSMEFLTGPSLKNNMYNIGVLDTFADVLKNENIDIAELFDMEPDAGTGNGGLGRLASCYMDSMTTLGVPATGFSIRYEFGIFKQGIIDGWQVEFPDDWLKMGDVWLRRRTDEAYEVKFGGHVIESFDDGVYRAEHAGYDTVMAVPYDMLITGYNTKAVNKLVLWSAQSANPINMPAFSRGDYMKSLEDGTMAEVISKVLYPADDHMEGKRLRIKQQYLLVSASLQSIISGHEKKYLSLDSFSEKIAIHINDTHPALCIPELMRILMDERGYGWDDAWKICGETFSYTNHTVMNEALERWPESLFKEQLPRIYQIVMEINRRLMIELRSVYHDDIAKIEYMAVAARGEIKMANLCLSCCHTINGVSKLHSEILTSSIFKDYYYINPQRFTNVTNGIAYRRWLCQDNPELSSFISELISDKFMKDATELTNLTKYVNDKTVLKRLEAIKHNNKIRLSDYIAKENGVLIDPNSIFDVQIKRLHEYKRQLLNVLHILHLYNKIKQNPNESIPAQTFIFGAKASAGYTMAKQVISLICTVSAMVNNDPAVRDKLKVIFIEDYKVSLASLIIPAADLSEQISIAGKEASGTGNMKLMINGAVTIGTLDGANVEIAEQVGEENIFLFGLHADEVEELWRHGYNPARYLRDNHDLQEVLNMLVNGALGKTFPDILNSLIRTFNGTADAYMILADFESYKEAQQLAGQTYADRFKFLNMSLINIAKAGIFSSDRAVRQYADNIWKL